MRKLRRESYYTDCLYLGTEDWCNAFKVWCNYDIMKCKPLNYYRFMKEKFRGIKRKEKPMDTGKTD